MLAYATKSKVNSQLHFGWIDPFRGSKSNMFGAFSLMVHHLRTDEANYVFSVPSKNQTLLTSLYKAVSTCFACPMSFSLENIEARVA